jgi:hypothetical protein
MIRHTKKLPYTSLPFLCLDVQRPLSTSAFYDSLVRNYTTRTNIDYSFHVIRQQWIIWQHYRLLYHEVTHVFHMIQLGWQYKNGNQNTNSFTGKTCGLKLLTNLQNRLNSEPRWRRGIFLNYWPYKCVSEEDTLFLTEELPFRDVCSFHISASPGQFSRVYTLRWNHGMQSPKSLKCQSSMSLQSLSLRSATFNIHMKKICWSDVFASTCASSMPHIHINILSADEQKQRTGMKRIISLHWKWHLVIRCFICRSMRLFKYFLYLPSLNMIYEYLKATCSILTRYGTHAIADLNKSFTCCSCCVLHPHWCYKSRQTCSADTVSDVATKRLANTFPWVFMSVVLAWRRSQWPQGLGRRSAAERLLGSWVRISPREWMFVSCECLCC